MRFSAVISYVSGRVSPGKLVNDYYKDSDVVFVIDELSFDSEWIMSFGVNVIVTRMKFRT